EINGEESHPIQAETSSPPEPADEVKESAAHLEADLVRAKDTATVPSPDYGSSTKFYSPLVRNIANEEGISIAQLDSIPGTGQDGRVTKNDILSYLEKRKSGASPKSVEQPKVANTQEIAPEE